MTTDTLTARRATARSHASAEGLSEHFFALSSSPGIPLAESLAELDLRYRVALEARGLSAETAVFTRFYLSDIANQMQALSGSRLYASAAAGAVAASHSTHTEARKSVPAGRDSSTVSLPVSP